MSEQNMHNGAPAGQPAAARARAGGRQRTPGPVAKARILVVDDEAGVRNLLHDVLSESFECARAASGAEAVEMADAGPFNVVLSDIMMPGLSGLELLEHLQRTSPETAVIMVTAVQDTRRAVEAIRLGAFDYILKPFNIEEVELSIQRALRYQALANENRFYQSQLESLVVERTSELQDANERLEAELLELSLCYKATVGALASALESRDVAAPGHTQRVAAYARRLGVQLGLGEGELSTLEQGAMLHDIGLISVPDSILRKPGKLEQTEWEMVRRHTEYGGQLLRQIGFLEEAAPIVEQHHERWDGNGYPSGLKGEEIDIKARVFAVADCIDVMTSGRPYRETAGFSEVAQELRRCSGTQFDPSVVDAFFAVPDAEWQRLRERFSR